ncbi:MAG: nitroreductase [Desulfovibrio sp.]|uniref:nitroreductase family protein n=1 Tax=Desulfovibrio sp. TaxID=885 RepID=UPI00135DD4BD|nr:nitroreductase family protein [Desulfovibrio sp.]MTJ93212.1 nitroreductase [Desulfovibrio sp.]
MAIPTSRTQEAATVSIESALCTGCGLCVTVCKDFNLRLCEGKACLAPQSLFGCVGCGHCMAVCPAGAISVRGRSLAPQDMFLLPPQNRAADFVSLQALLHRRRSVREFLPDPVPQEQVQAILDAARTAPTGVPPSDVNVLVLDSIEKSRGFTRDFCEHLKTLRWLTAPWFLTLMRPFWGRANHELFSNFVRPALAAFTASMDEGTNIVTYDAPLLMYFYASPLADPADPVVAATLAMLAGEALGLGTCMIGSMHPLIQWGGSAARFRQRHGIRCKSREGLVVLFGHSRVRYTRGIERSFASVTRP